MGLILNALKAATTKTPDKCNFGCGRDAKVEAHVGRRGKLKLCFQCKKEAEF